MSLRILVGAALLLQLAACGGGGSGSGADELEQMSGAGPTSADVREADREDVDLTDSDEVEQSSDAPESAPAQLSSDVLRSCGSPTRPLKIMPFGDSITEAERGHNSYRRSLWFQLSEAGCVADFVGGRRGVSDAARNTGGQRPPNADFDLEHEGRWDYRADELFGIAANAVSTYAPDVILIHVGTNDILRGQSAASTASDIATLIDSVRRAKPDIVIFLAQVIPASERRSTLIELNGMLPAVVQAKLDPRSPLILVDQFSGYFVSDNYDGIHPSRSGEAKLASNWLNALLSLIAAQ